MLTEGPNCDNIIILQKIKSSSTLHIIDVYNRFIFWKKSHRVKKFQYEYYFGELFSEAEVSLRSP